VRARILSETLACQMITVRTDDQQAGRP